MSRKDASALLNIMESCNIPELDIMGGEPFVVPWMPDFIRDASGRGLAVNVSTNGSLLPALKPLEGISPASLTIGISLEGSSEERHNRITGSRNFAAALESLSWLSQAGLDPLVKTVLTRETAPDVREIVRLVRERGIQRYYLIHMDLLSPNGQERAAPIGYPEFAGFVAGLQAGNPDIEINSVSASCFNGAASSMNIRCAAGTRKVAVMPDGSVFPCNLFHRYPEFRLGNILSDDLSALMENPQLAYFRSFSGNTCPSPDCSNRPACTGGCPAHGYYHFRDTGGRDLRCSPGDAAASLITAHDDTAP